MRQEDELRNRAECVKGQRTRSYTCNTPQHVKTRKIILYHVDGERYHTSTQYTCFQTQ